MTAETMTAYLVAGQVEPDRVARTNAEGTVKFEQLQTGLYLVMEEKVQKGNAAYVFEDFFCICQRRWRMGNTGMI